MQGAREGQGGLGDPQSAGRAGGDPESPGRVGGPTESREDWGDHCSQALGME